MFSAATFRFLRELQDNNDVPWFHANKQRYEDHVRTPALELIRAWASAMDDTAYVGEASKIGGALSPPNKDIRFSQDKRPYRTHIAIRLRHRFVLPGAQGPTFLLWIAPRDVFISAGVHNPKSEALRRIRRGIASASEAWLAVRGLGALDDGDMLARSPVQAPESVLEDVRRTHYTITRRLRQSDVCTGDVAGRVVRHAREMLPFNAFMENALYGMVIER